MYGDFSTFPTHVSHTPPPKVKYPLPQEHISQTNPRGLISTAEHGQQSVSSAVERTMRIRSVTRAAESVHCPTFAHRMLRARCVVDGNRPNVVRGLLPVYCIPASYPRFETINFGLLQH